MRGASSSYYVTKEGVYHKPHDLQIILRKKLSGKISFTISHISFQITIGFSFFQAKEFDQAILLLNQLSPDLPTNDLKAEAQYWIAESYVGKNEFDIAITEFQRLRTSFPRETRWTGLSEFRIAELHHDQGDIDTANAIFREIIRVHGAASDLGREAAKYLN